MFMFQAIIFQSYTLSSSTISVSSLKTIPSDVSVSFSGKFSSEERLGTDRNIVSRNKICEISMNFSYSSVNYDLRTSF